MASNGVTRVVIADDHPVFCVGVATLITAQGWEVCATAGDGEEAVTRATEMRPDIVIMNYEMHRQSCSDRQSGSDRLNGLEAARRIKRALPQVEVLMFSGTRSRRALLQMYRSSVGGCLLKSEGAEELLAALESLRQHQRFRSRQITEICEMIDKAAEDLDTLTARETATLRLIVDAKLSKEIAAELGISIKTVEIHRSNLFRKLKVRSVVELVRYALRHGLVDI